MSDAALLGTVERYFVEIMAIPRLQQRIDCFIFTRSFQPGMQRVHMIFPSTNSFNEVENGKEESCAFALHSLRFYEKW